jgi:hypothetical protein
MMSLTRLARALRLRKRQLGLPLAEFEALLLRRLQARAAKRLPPPGPFITEDQLRELAKDPQLRAAGEMARARLGLLIADEASAAQAKRRRQRASA